MHAFVVLLVGVAAGVGALTRYVVDQLVESTHQLKLPLGTVVINVSGSFVLGLLTGLGLHHGLDSDVITVLGAGLLGGYTTFSTWSWESVTLAGDREILASGMNVAVSVLGGGVAAAAGLGLALL